MAPVRLQNNKIYGIIFSGLLVIYGYAGTCQKDTIKIPTSNQTLVLPVIARSIETNWSFGVASTYTFHIDPKVRLDRTSNLEGLVLYTLNKQFVAAINGSIYFPGEKYIISQQLSYSYYPDEFWGLGKYSQDSSAENYSYRQYYVYLHMQAHIGNKMFLGLLYEYQRLFLVKYDSGGLFDQEMVPGRAGYHISGFGGSFTYDTRNNAFSPDQGVMLQFYFNRFAHYFGSDYDYTNFVIDLRKFIKIYWHEVLALQVYGFFNSGETPLRSLALLGGANYMRGYYQGRYRDKNMAVLQSEYRIPLFWRFGATVFGDLGNVAPNLTGINFQAVKYSYGAGIRFALNTNEKLNLRLDYGIGEGKSNGFYLQLGEAF